MTEHLSEREGVPLTEHKNGLPYSSSSYNRGCRCEWCKKAKANQYQEKKGRPPLHVIPVAPGVGPKRPPGVVWMDWSGLTAVVRCERCQKNYGVWLDPTPAREFAQKHADMHAGEPPFDWSAYDQARLFKAPGGRPPLEERPLCSEPTCTKDARAKGLCEGHYKAASRAALREAL